MSDGHGSAPGEYRGGRQKGVKNKATLEHENLISRAMGKLDRPLGKEVIAEVMMEFRGLAQDRDILSALPPEKVGMLAPPLGSAVPVFSDNDPEAKCYRWRQVIAMLAAATIGFLSPSRISAAQLSPVITPATRRWRSFFLR